MVAGGAEAVTAGEGSSRAPAGVFVAALAPPTPGVGSAGWSRAPGPRPRPLVNGSPRLMWPSHRKENDIVNDTQRITGVLSPSSAVQVLSLAEPERFVASAGGSRRRLARVSGRTPRRTRLVRERSSCCRLVAPVDPRICGQGCGACRLGASHAHAVNSLRGVLICRVYYNGRERRGLSELRR